MLQACDRTTCASINYSYIIINTKSINYSYIYNKYYKYVTNLIHKLLSIY